MAAKGSFLLKLLIIVFILVLVAVIYIPDQIWTEERSMEKTSRENMTTLYEAQHYFHSKTKRYLPSDSLSQLVDFIRTDSSLLEKQKIGDLTGLLSNGISEVLKIPILQSIIPISSGIAEINGDLEFNTRYFEKYDHILQQKEEIAANLKKFQTSYDYPNFNALKLYADSLYLMRDRVNEYSLQRSAQLTQSYIDSIMRYMPNSEISSIGNFWKGEYGKINKLTRDIKGTDIVTVSSVADRLKKFIERVNAGMTDLSKINIQQDVQSLEKAKENIANIYTQFTQPENLFITQKNGLIQLSETDSMLIKFNENHFYDPDTIDGKQMYIVHFEEDTSATLVVESPNLLDGFQKNLIQATEPIQNLSIYPYIDKIQASLDSTASTMVAEKDKHKLARYSTDLLLDMKELTTEMQDISGLQFINHTKNLQAFADTVKTEKRLSALEKLIKENILTSGIDSLASRIAHQDISELQKKMDEFGKKTKALDSLVVATVPANVSRQITPFYSSFENVYTILNDLKSACNPEDAEKIRQASIDIEKSLSEILNGYHENVYGVFNKKHVNHGYVENGQKSWEMESE